MMAEQQRNVMDHISKHITYAEATKSNTAIRLGISNDPTSEQIEAMEHVAKMIFEPVRRDVAGGKPLLVSSFFRSEDVNSAVNGSLTSQHVKGEAIDIDADYFDNGTNREIFEYIRENLNFDQLIWEYGDDKNPAWIHVSLRKKGKNRKKVLRAERKSGRTEYKRM